DARLADTKCLGRMPKIQMLGDGDELNKGNERYPARQDTDIHEDSMVSAPHRSGPATSRRLDDWRLLGGSPTEPKEHQPQRNQYRHRRGVTDHGPRCVTVYKCHRQCPDNAEYQALNAEVERDGCARAVVELCQSAVRGNGHREDNTGRDSPHR